MSKWEMVRLGDVCDVRDGTHDSPKYVDHGYPLVTSKNVVSGYIDITDVNYISEEDYKKINVRSGVDDGDIIMPMIGTIGNPVVVNKTFDFAIKNVALVKFIRNSVFNRYALYILTSSIFKNYIEKENRGGTQKFISLGNIRNFTIPLPPFETQKQIAKTLDTAADLLAMRKQQLAELDSLIKSTFYDMFGDPVTNEKGWPVVFCKETVDILTGYPFKSEEYSNDKTQIKLCGGLIIMPDKIEWGKCNYWPNLKAKGLKRYELYENDIVLAMDRPWISSGLKIGMINKADLPTLLIQRTARLRAINIEQCFLYYLFKDRSFTIHCKPTETTVPHISINDINSFGLILPPSHLQNQFAEIVTKIEEQKALVKKAIDETQYLFDSLMSEYFE